MKSPRACVPHTVLLLTLAAGAIEAHAQAWAMVAAPARTAQSSDSGPRHADQSAEVLGQWLGHPSAKVRWDAAKALRALGPNARPAHGALLAYLRTRDNVWLAAQALAYASPTELLAVQADLESIVAEPQVSSWVKAPVEALLMRIEHWRALDSAEAMRPTADRPTPWVIGQTGPSPL